MNRRTSLALATAVVSGALVALQQRVNGELAVSLDDPVLAAVVSFGTGLALVLAVVLSPLSLLAAPAQAWLPGARAAKSRSWAGSPRRVTRNRQGWLFPADGAQRAASSSAARASSPISCARSNPRGLHRSASSG